MVEIHQQIRKCIFFYYY